jgi:hypothetical protein
MVTFMVFYVWDCEVKAAFGLQSYFLESLGSCRLAIRVVKLEKFLADFHLLNGRSFVV